MEGIISTIISSIKNISIWSILDILVVSYIFYKAYKIGNKNIAVAHCGTDCGALDVDRFYSDQHIVDRNFQHNSDRHVDDGYILLADCLKHICERNGNSGKHRRNAQNRNHGRCNGNSVRTA